MKILNFGSLNIDYVYSVDHFVKKGETISSDGLEVFSGGKGLNQSIAMGRAGISVFHAGAVGTDGESLLQLLRQAGVSTEKRFRPATPSFKETGAAITVLFYTAEPIKAFPPGRLSGHWPCLRPVIIWCCKTRLTA